MSKIENAFERKVMGNIGWQALAVLGRVGISIVALAILARIAGPEVMGHYGLAWVAIALGFAVAQSGAAQSIIAIDNFRQPHLAASFVMVMGMSGCFGLIMAFFAPAVGVFYGQPEVERAYVMGAIFMPLMALGAIDIAMAQKQLNFRFIARVQTISTAFSAICAVALAILWDPLLGLFALQGLTGIFQFILFRIYRYPWPPLRFALAELRDIWSVGMHLSLNSLTSVLLINLPHLIIARFLPMEAVGIFTLARRIIEMIGSQIGGLVNQVVYPSFSVIKEDRMQIGKIFLLTTHYTAFFMMLPLLVLSASPGDFLALYVGEEWRTGGTVLLMLVLMQAGFAMGQNVFPTFQAIGKPSAAWRWNLLLMIIQVVLILAFGRESIENAAAAIAMSVIIMPLAALWLSIELGFSFVQWCKNMLKIIPPALVIGVFSYCEVSSWQMEPIGRLVAGAGVSIGVYFIIVVLLDSYVYKLIIAKIRS